MAERRKKLIRAEAILPMSPDDVPVTFSGPSPERGDAGNVARMTLAMEARRGPMPEAAEMARYKEVDPEAPRVILAEFQRQAEHRRAMEVRALAIDETFAAASIAADRRGTFCALAVVLTFLAASVSLIATSHDVAGTVLGTVDLVALATVFVFGRVRGDDTEGDAK
ncbi:MAG: hypothetical protein JWM27_3967 [Gemmatimonadetes bacterium]|nr:hypothetical protein [Gemmatimonadota bacterium]